MKNAEPPKKHKKRRSDEHHHHHEKQSKRFRENSNDEDNTVKKDPENIEATYVNHWLENLIILFFFRSDVEDMVDDIFGKDVNDNEVWEMIYSKNLHWFLLGGR